MKMKSNQKGMTFLGIVIILGIIVFFALVLLKVTPLYLENTTINSTLDSLLEDTEIGKKGKKAMISRIDSQFYINDVKTIAGKDIKFEKSREKKVWIVSANYEARTVLFKNIGVFIDFKKTIEVPR